MVKLTIFFWLVTWLLLTSTKTVLFMNISGITSLLKDILSDELLMKTVGLIVS